jgi:fucose permease
MKAAAAAVYASGLVQGLALVTFPAASAVFTSPAAYGLSSTQYGAMFIPQAVTAIAFSLLGAAFTRRLGAARIFRLGLLANLAAMALLVASRFFMQAHVAAYVLLLAATACLGAGFGLTVPTLNTFAATLFPQQVDKAVLALNALLGLGTALAPVFVALFVGLGLWWGLPVGVGGAVLVLLVASARLDLPGVRVSTAAAPTRSPTPRRFWVFAAFALVYGVCETMDGNWASLTMARELGASPAQASLGLSVFWGMVTAGRVLFAFTERWFSERSVCRWLPLVLAASFVALAGLRHGQGDMGIAAFGLAGLGCSVLLPAVISFGQAELKTMAATVAGALIGCYQIGYGVAAFGVGPLQSAAGWSLGAIYGGTTAVALVLAALAWVVTRPPAAAGAPAAPARA